LRIALRSARGLPARARAPKQVEAHLRPRTNVIGAVTRVRHTVARLEA
jgi:hypothetical protein